MAAALVSDDVKDSDTMFSKDLPALRRLYLTMFSPNAPEPAEGSPASELLMDAEQTRKECMEALSAEDRTLVADLAHHGRDTVGALLAAMAQRERVQNESPSVGAFHKEGGGQGERFHALAILVFAAVAVSLLTKEGQDDGSVEMFAELVEAVRLFRGEGGEPRSDEDKVLLRTLFEGAFAFVVKELRQDMEKAA